MLLLNLQGLTSLTITSAAISPGPPTDQAVMGRRVVRH